jgi:hypothetical protein
MYPAAMAGQETIRLGQMRRGFQLLILEDGLTLRVEVRGPISRLQNQGNVIRTE